VSGHSGGGILPPLRKPKVWFSCGRNRYTAVISVPEMTSNTDGNIIVNAISYARIGRDDPRISVMRVDRRVIATYESLQLANKNIEYAVAF